METTGQYELIDFGDGRKLESLAGYVIDRPSPAAEGTRPADPRLWADASARYDLRKKNWLCETSWPEPLSIDCNGFVMPVRPTPFGHIGLFPEQSGNWSWLQSLSPGVGDSLALNLFGYTGASTLAMSSVGFQVAHVDAARPSVQACREAANVNGWGEAKIRYLVEDAAKFAAREVRRGRRYRVIVMDPPAYGHGPGGKAWRLERDLWPLLDSAVDLLADEFALLVTGHSPQVDQRDVAEFLSQHEKLQALWRRSGLNLSSGRSQLTSRLGRTLDAGFFVRLSTNGVSA